MSSWSSRERVAAAIAHRTSDRLPLTFDAQPEVYARLYAHFGLSPSDRAALFDRLGVDTWMVGPRHQGAPPEPDERGERTSIWGYRTRRISYGGGAYDEFVHAPLAGRDEVADIRRHAWPSPAQIDFSELPDRIAQGGERAVIGAFTWGPFFIASVVRGMEDLLVDFAVRPTYAHALIERIGEISEAALDTLLERHGARLDIVYMADDYCSHQAPLFSPAMFRTFVMPYLRRYVEKVHRRGQKFLLHCCGAVRPLLPMIIEAGVDVLEPIQITAAGMEPAALKRDFGRDLCFYGGVDLQHILNRGTPERVAEEVRRLADVLGEGGGYILGPGHTYIQVDAPTDNILAMYATGRQQKSGADLKKDADILGPRVSSGDGN